MFSYFVTAIKEVWQDRRTLWIRMYLPFLLFIGFLFIVSLSLNSIGDAGTDINSTTSNGQASESPRSIVGIVTNDNGDSLVEQLKIIETVDYKIIENIDTVQEMMNNGVLDLAIVIDEFFDDAIKTGNSGEILVYHDGYNDALKEGIKNNIDWYERRVLNQRLAKTGYDASYIDPVNISEVNAYEFQSSSNNDSSNADDNATIFNEIGGIFILLFFYFAWLGGIYPSLALFTTDRLSSIETDEPQKVLIGRTMAVAVFSLLHALLFLSFVFIIFKPYQSSGSLYGAMIKTALRSEQMLLIIASSIPLVALFATFKSWSVIKQGTFKDAQNRLQPLKLSVFVFILIGITAGFGTSLAVYIIPLINIGALSRLLLLDNVNWLYMGVTYVSCFSIAYWCNQFALKEFNKRVRKPVITSEIENNFLENINSENDEV